MKNLFKCAQCDNPATISLTDGKGGCIGNLCADCYNRRMSINYYDAMPTDIPEVLKFNGSDEKIYKFKISLKLKNLGKRLTATEVGGKKRVFDLYGNLEDNVDEMLNTLSKRIEESLVVKT